MSKNKEKLCGRCKKTGHITRHCNNKKKNPPEKIVYNLHVLYDERSSGGDICYGDEDEAFPNHEPEYNQNEFLGIVRDYDFERDRKKFYGRREPFEVTQKVYEATEAYIPVVYYSSGSTFGSSHGHVCILGVFLTLEDAKKDLAYCLKDAEKNGNSYQAGRRYYPWLGYFESLETTEIIKLPISDQFEPQHEGLDDLSDTPYSYRDLTNLTRQPS